MKLELPYPVSANRYWRSFVPKGWKRAVVHPSDEARAYKRECAWLAKAAGFKPLGGAVELHILLIPANRVCMDLDNALKVSIDALRGIVYEDDAQVYRIVAERRAPDGKARLEVEAQPFDMPVPLFEHAAAA